MFFSFVFSFLRSFLFIYLFFFFMPKLNEVTEQTNRSSIFFNERLTSCENAKNIHSSDLKTTYNRIHRVCCEAFVFGRGHEFLQLIGNSRICPGEISAEFVEEELNLKSNSQLQFEFPNYAVFGTIELCVK